MYKHDTILTLPRHTASLWRFMPLPALLSILQRKQLFFAAITQMPDPFDGSLPIDVKYQYWNWAGFSPSDYECSPGSLSDNVGKVVRGGTCISCWHANSVQSAAMWSLYSPHHGVAVKSTVQRLIKAVDATPTWIRIGMVKYVDFGAPKKSEADGCLSEEFVKRKSFDHERELRAVTFDLDVSRSNGQKRGVFIDIDVAELIEAVYISPTVEDWLTEIVKHELTIHDLPDVPVMHSGLYSRDLK